MSTTLERAPTLSRSVNRFLLACGIAYGVLYVIANDAIAAVIYDGYNRIDQAISELSSTEAPSRTFLNVMLPFFSFLVIAFGIGVWRSAGDNRGLRVTGGILLAQGIGFPLWLLAPMTTREELVAGGGGGNDTGHMVLSAFAILAIVTEMAVSAMALGKGFRIFSLVAGASVLVFGAMVPVMSSGMEAGDPTPWMGFVERISYGAWLVWMAGLAIVLMRRSNERLSPAST